MNKAIKTIACVILALSIVFTFSSVVFAAEESSAEPQATCTHSWNAGYTEYVEGAGINATSTTCQRRKVTAKTCTKCGQTKVTYSYTGAMNHSWYINNAKCDGTWQTHTYKCRYCNTYRTETIKCPAAGHGGTCPVLPI